jgi:hypothetical protein
VQRPRQNRELMILFSMLWLKHRRITSGNGGGSRHGHINSSTAKAWKQSAHAAGHGYSCRSNLACPVWAILARSKLLRPLVIYDSVEPAKLQSCMGQSPQRCLIILIKSHCLSTVQCTGRWRTGVSTVLCAHHASSRIFCGCRWTGWTWAVRPELAAGLSAPNMGRVNLDFFFLNLKRSLITRSLVFFLQ